MIAWKTSCLHFLPSATNQQIVKKGSLASRIRPVTRSSLNLPSLVISQKLNHCDKLDDINEVFLKLSMLYSNLHDPMRELLLQCACEDQQKRYQVSYFDKFSTNLVPKEAYCSPRPDHMPLTKRRLSNKAANERRAFGVYRQDIPLPTIIARWIPKTMTSQYDQQSVIQELTNFGDIESLTPFGRQTVIVTFKEICSACKAVSAFPPNGPKRHLQCFWHHKFLSKYEIPKDKRAKL
ncbi:testis expressed protein 56-like [Candoia aspera]|uniref:testis expressed protein 56-like n=1 Tax=Candoia aspera TaxID=51853 RepID=UPI002FD7DB66